MSLNVRTQTPKNTFILCSFIYMKTEKTQAKLKLCRDACFVVKLKKIIKLNENGFYGGKGIGSWLGGCFLGCVAGSVS